MRMRISWQFRRFMRWWVQELLACLPVRVSRLCASLQERLILSPEPAALVIGRCRGDVHHELVRVDLPAATSTLASLPGVGRLARTSTVVLRLSGREFLSRHVRLPLATEENLRAVLAFEMDRLTPFTADQVYYDYRMLERSRREGTATIELVLVTRQRLDALLAQVAGIGLSAHVVDALLGPPDGEPGCSPCRRADINLLPRNRRPGASRVDRLNLGLAIVLSILVTMTLALPLWRLHQVAQELELAVANAQRQADAATLIGKRVQSRVAELKALFTRRRDTPTAIELVSGLARVLPDGTWLTQLEISDGRMRMQGESDGASALIGLLEASPPLHAASFESPVIQNPENGRQRFRISAQIAARRES